MEKIWSYILDHYQWLITLGVMLIIGVIGIYQNKKNRENRTRLFNSQGEAAHISDRIRNEGYEPRWVTELKIPHYINQGWEIHYEEDQVGIPEKVAVPGLHDNTILMKREKPKNIMPE